MTDWSRSKYWWTLGTNRNGWGDLNRCRCNSILVKRVLRKLVAETRSEKIQHMMLLRKCNKNIVYCPDPNLHCRMAVQCRAVAVDVWRRSYGRKISQFLCDSFFGWKMEWLQFTYDICSSAEVYLILHDYQQSINEHRCDGMHERCTIQCVCARVRSTQPTAKYDRTIVDEADVVAVEEKSFSSCQFSECTFSSSRQFSALKIN
jgi:hypothetical protein